MKKPPIFFLIGFMGSGKSLLAESVSRILDCKVIEMDAEIEKKYGAKIRDIFSEKGEEYFRKLEREVLNEVISYNDQSRLPVLISTGGGAPCFFDNLRIMSDSGTTIYLRPRNELLMQRLEKDKEDRPLVRHKSSEEILEFIEQKVSTREKYYMQAYIVLNPVNEGVQDLAYLLKEIILS